MTRRIILFIFAMVLQACSVLPIPINPLESLTPTVIDQIVTSDGVEPSATDCPSCQTPSTPDTPVDATATIPVVAPTETNTPEPVVSPTGTNTTKPVVEPTVTPTLIPTETTKPYSLQSNTPVYQSNFAQPDKGCDWMGVVGQAFDLNGNPVKNLVLVIEGTLTNIPVESIGVTGVNLPYGPSGYEIVLSRKPLDSVGTLYITLYDLAGNPLSNPIYFNTYGTCDKNLVIINFKQTGP